MLTAVTIRIMEKSDHISKIMRKTKFGKLLYINQFIERYLVRHTWVDYTVFWASVFAAGANTVLWFIGFSAGLFSVVFLVVALLALTYRASKAMLLFFVGQRGNVIANPEIDQIWSKLSLDNTSHSAGYEILTTPILYIPKTGNLVPIPEKIVRSAKVDAYIRKSDVKLAHKESLEGKMKKRFQENSQNMEKILRWQYSRSGQGEFADDEKLCLCGTIDHHDSGPIHIFQGSYYASSLSNEMVVNCVESSGPEPEVIYRGSDSFFVRQADGSYVLDHSALGNHIGISTIIHTSDNKMIIWRQGQDAQQSQGLLAPTGSGSCDWKDWLTIRDMRPTLREVIGVAMERELTEESSLKLHEVSIETTVLGFFRWIRRGAKPEFVGMSKISASSDDLVPDSNEVFNPKSVTTTFDAGNIQELETSLESIKAAQALSLPLWALVNCVTECILTDPETITEALGWR